jgi:very-short-patch-repair endonuclease
MIDRHGEEVGSARWDAYCERQRYTISIEYFIEKYGKKEGLAKYNSFCEKRAHAGFNLYSNIEKEFILWFTSTMKLSLFDDTIFALDRQYQIDEKFYDFTDTKKMKIIEFNGDLWHANPKLYDDKFVDPYGRSAIEIWENDNYKQKIARKAGFDIYYVWEYDYRNYPDETKQQILRWWKE